MERQKPFTKHHSVWQTFWKTHVRSHGFISSKLTLKLFYSDGKIGAPTHMPTVEAAGWVSRSGGKSLFQHSRFRLDLDFVMIHEQWCVDHTGNKKVGDKTHFLKAETVIFICAAESRCP